MSDRVTPADIEAAKLRDSRFTEVARAVAIQTDLRDNETIRSLLAAVKKDADGAMRTLADLTPTDCGAVSKALVKIQTLVYIRDTLDHILRRGDLAIASLQAEDEAWTA